MFCLFLYFENKNSFIKFFVMLLSVEFFNNISNIILLFYNIKNIAYVQVIASISSFFEFAILGLLIANLTKIKIGVVRMLLILFVLLLASLSMVADDFVKESTLNFFLKDVNFLLYLVVFYYLYLTIRGYFSEKNSDIKLILGIIAASFIFAVPFAVIRETFFPRVLYFNHLEDSFTYLILSIGGFILFFKKISLKFEIKRETENSEIVTIPAPQQNQTVTYEPTAKLDLSNFLLTQRELEITKLIMDGFTNQDIADKLFISIKTVKTHIYNVYQKLDIKNRTELIYKFNK